MSIHLYVQININVKYDFECIHSPIPYQVTMVIYFERSLSALHKLRTYAQAAISSGGTGSIMFLDNCYMNKYQYEPPVALF